MLGGRLSSFVVAGLAGPAMVVLYETLRHGTCPIF